MMKKTILAVMLSAATFASAVQAADRVGVTIYKYDDNFMSTMRKSLEGIAARQSDLKLLMNDSQNNQSMQNDQVDILLAKGVKALAINLVDPAAVPPSSTRPRAVTCRWCSSTRIQARRPSIRTPKPGTSGPIRCSRASSRAT